MTCMDDWNDRNRHEGIFRDRPDTTWSSSWGPHTFERHRGSFGDPDKIVKKNWLGEVVSVRRDYFA